MHVHALDDTHVLFSGGAGKDAFPDKSMVTDFTSVPEAIARWVAHDGGDPTPQRVLEVVGAHADLYTSKQNAAQVELVVTDTGGHSWPGSRGVPGRQPSQAIYANDIIWEFFARQVRK
jgi:polyhydroxybutyrate depolymerase